MMDTVLLDQIVVGAAASLVNLIIHAVLIGGVAWTIRRLSRHDSFVPAFLQYTIVIVATGTLLVAGHFAEVMVWAFTYALVEPYRPAPTSSISPSGITRRSAMATSCPSSAGICSGR